MNQSPKFSIAVAGATGLVGRKMIELIDEFDLPFSSLKLLASSRSEGEIINFRNKEYKVEKLDENSFDDVDIALFSAGGTASKEFAPIAAKKKCIVIDNSSAWRMDADVPLVVPEVNSHALNNHNFIIANPNCSTIQLVLPLKIINDNFGLKRVVISTYQSITGAGNKGLSKLIAEEKGESNGDKHKIYRNAMFHAFLPEKPDWTNEEVKMINETRKILELPDLRVTATCVRLPIVGGHGESVNIETDRKVDIELFRSLLKETEGIVVVDDLSNEEYPTPALSNNRNEVFVGRIRHDESVENGLHLWVVADNVRKGAATNAVQIADYMIKNNMIIPKN